MNGGPEHLTSCPANSFGERRVVIIMFARLLVTRAHDGRIPYPVSRIRITEKIQCISQMNCDYFHTHSTVVQRCNRGEWQILREGYGYKIQYTHVICTRGHPNKIVRNLTLRRKPSSLVSLAASCLLNYANHAKLSSSDIIFANHICERNPNMKLFIFSANSALFPLPESDDDDEENYQVLSVYDGGVEATRSFKFYCESADCCDLLRSFIIQPARSISDVYFRDTKLK